MVDAAFLLSNSYLSIYIYLYLSFSLINWCKYFTCTHGDHQLQLALVVFFFYVKSPFTDVHKHMHRCALQLTLCGGGTSSKNVVELLKYVHHMHMGALFTTCSRAELPSIMQQRREARSA